MRGIFFSPRRHAGRKDFTPAFFLSASREKKTNNSFLTSHKEGKLMLSESSECKAEKRALPRRISLFRKDISGISADGIFLKKGGYIRFCECAAAFHRSFGGSGCCVGERDITSFSFSFYTASMIIDLSFIKNKKKPGFFSRCSARHSFLKMQKKLSESGYTTRDMS